MRLWLKICLTLYGLSVALGATSLPEIGTRDVKQFIEEMLKAHATHKHLSPLLSRRIINETLEALDPLKVYFLEGELQEWLTLSEKELEKLSKTFEKGDFSKLAPLFDRMEAGAERRSHLEQENAHRPCENASKQPVRAATWAKSEEELKERLFCMQSAIHKAVERLGQAHREKVLQRIQKKRLLHEESAAAKDPVERERFRSVTLLKALSTSLDAHTAYFTPSEATEFIVQVQQRLSGIGVGLRDDINGFTVVKIIEGSPASKTSLRINDRIVAINGEPIVGMELVDAVTHIRGGAGSRALVSILRDLPNGEEESLDIEVVRDEVVVQEGRIETHVQPFGEGVIAHISLHAFYQDAFSSSAEDILDVLVKLQKEKKLLGVVLDLRRNVGGVLPQAVSVTGLFINKGIVVSVKDNSGHIEHLRNLEGRPAWEGPLLVLTSKASASAAEIVAQALQDYGRALVVGDEHTYGKGSFQTFTLDAESSDHVNPKGEFKVTRGLYYTVSGKSPQLVGVSPDILVPGLSAFLEVGERYAKYPLAADAIPEHFSDDFSDLPPMKKEQMNWLMRFNVQRPLTTFSRHLPTLKENSRERLEKNPFYQLFQKSLQEQVEESDPKSLECFSLADPQLQESFEIMKDLILLCR